MAIIRKQQGQFNKDKGQSFEGQPNRHGGKFRKGALNRKKICRFCADKIDIDYKNISLLRSFTTESGKVLPGRATGACAKHQRALIKAVKRARILAMLPFLAKNI
ncbi:MAG: 30S ribosomal protein S18 [Elusimicrobiota bacterium]|jgi:small subunit ribosomal protein S18|nr:30S ribosomal protein S18 [Elusimicrobiota bacterium]